ncbi:MAG: hypothetical protein ABIQ73_02710 [Acidimicrobiales bacterium]
MKPPSAFAWAPLRWLLAAIAAVIGFTVLGITDADFRNRPFDDAIQLQGVVAGDYDGRSLKVPITYDNPLTEQLVETTFRVANYGDVPEPASTIAIDVGRDNPRAIRIQGLAVPRDEDRVELAEVAALLSLGPLLLRWFGLRQSRRLIDRPDKSFVMTAALGSHRRGRRPLLHLYPLDSNPSAAAVCVVPLAASYGLPVGGEYFTVEVKGSPRPFGRVVARLESGEILWPAARALASRGKHARPTVSLAHGVPVADRPTAIRLVSISQQMPFEVAVFGALVIFATAMTLLTLRNSDWASTVAARSVPTNAEVVNSHSSDVVMRYSWNGSDLTARAPAQSGGGYQRGLRYPILVDPRDPSSIRTAMEPYNTAGPIIWAWLVAGIAALPVAHRLSQRWSARRHIRRGPWQTMFAVTPRTTPRFAVVQLHAFRDWPGSRRGLLLLPQVKPWRDLPTGREVIVCGTLNTLDSPTLIIDGKAHIPASRMYFAHPLLSRRK